MRLVDFILLMVIIIMDKDVVIRDGRTLAGCDTYPVFINKGAIV